MPHKSVIQAMMVAHMHSGTVADHGTMRRVLRAALDEAMERNAFVPDRYMAEAVLATLCEAVCEGDDIEHT